MTTSGALLCCICGMAWLALALAPHWHDVRGDILTQDTRRTLRALGTVSLGTALLLFCRADHASIAALVWFMALAASALAVAFLLAWRPRALACLVVWVPRERGEWNFGSGP